MATAYQQEKVDAIFLTAALFGIKAALEHRDWDYGLISLNTDQTKWNSQKDICCLIKKTWDAVSQMF